MIKMAYNTRRKIIKTPMMQSSESQSDFSDSGSEYQASSSSTEEDLTDTSCDSDSNSSTENIAKGLNNCMDNIIKTGTKSDDKVYIISSDDYFSNSSQKKPAISNNGLNKLETPRLHHDQLYELVSNEHTMIKHKTDLKNLEAFNRTQFNRWLYLLHEGFNILLYGLGSKIKILTEFQESFLNDLPVVIVNGFFPSLTIRNIIDAVLEILDLSQSFANVFEACDMIVQELLHIPTIHIYVIVHNIEGDMLKNAKSQNVLSRLAAIRNIHVIASVDHVSSPLIWDNSKLSRFNFIWCDATSFLPYINETAFEGSMVVERSRSLALSSLNNVFISLTSNSKSIYLIIVKFQLEHGNNQHYQGFLFKDLYWSCREAFLVSSDLALRSQLTEFVDHKLLKFRRSADGSEYLIIPTASNILQQFLDQHSK